MSSISFPYVVLLAVIASCSNEGSSYYGSLPEYAEQQVARNPFDAIPVENYYNRRPLTLQGYEDSQLNPESLDYRNPVSIVFSKKNNEFAQGSSYNPADPSSQNLRRIISAYGRLQRDFAVGAGYKPPSISKVRQRWGLESNPEQRNNYSPYISHEYWNFNNDEKMQSEIQSNLPVVEQEFLKQQLQSIFRQEQDQHLRAAHFQSLLNAKYPNYKNSVVIGHQAVANYRNYFISLFIDGMKVMAFGAAC